MWLDLSTSPVALVWACFFATSVRSSLWESTGWFFVGSTSLKAGSSYWKDTSSQRGTADEHENMFCRICQNSASGSFRITVPMTKMNNRKIKRAKFWGNRLGWLKHCHYLAKQKWEIHPYQYQLVPWIASIRYICHLDLDHLGVSYIASYVASCHLPNGQTNQLLTSLRSPPVFWGSGHPTTLNQNFLLIIGTVCYAATVYVNTNDEWGLLPNPP